MICPLLTVKKWRLLCVSGDRMWSANCITAPDLRRVLRVSFVNAAGADEAGYGEGVTREFFQQLIRTAFEPSRGLFQLTADGDLCPNPYADRIMENPEEHYHFLGRLLGKVRMTLIVLIG